MENYQYTPLQPQYVGMNPTMASFPQMAQTADLAAVPSFVYTGYNLPVSQMPAGQPDPLSNLMFLGTYGASRDLAQPKAENVLKKFRSHHFTTALSVCFQSIGTISLW
jgi:hypothetical protein